MSNCLFCRIASGEIKTDFVYQDDQVVAFRDINPQAPVHVLVIPRKHVASLDDVKDEDAPLLAHLMATLGRLGREMEVHGSGYRVVTNHGADAGQTVDHLHFHLLAGRPLAWPPG
ncbi:MAG TPA: histidine triad nucleotide-binding protein [Candidatus Xenobia bacterium]|jgi:histidine triad (HIT) family protein